MIQRPQLAPHQPATPHILRYVYTSWANISAFPPVQAKKNRWICKGGYGTMGTKEGVVGAVVFASHARLGHVIIEPSARVFALGLTLRCEHQAININQSR